MSLSDVCIKRPVFASMMSLALILLGVVALLRLPVRELPDIDPPIITVQTVYPGANARVVETEVTEKLEDVVNGVEGIKTLTSESREEFSSITVEFTLSRPIDIAAQDVRDRVSRVRNELPDDIDDPIVAKQDSDARPMMWVAVYSDNYTTQELTDISDRILKESLQTVNGVSSVIFGGEKRFAVRIRLDSKKMSAHGITVLDVEDALRAQNVELPSGRVENLGREFVIQTLGEIKKPEEFNRVVLKREGDALVRIEDVGFAESGVEDERSVARYNSRPAIGLGIIKQSQSNTLDVAAGIKEELERRKGSLPDGVEFFVAYDESIFVDKAIDQVWSTLSVAFILVVFTIYAFLRNVRSTIIPVIAIPVSVISTFAVLGLMGYSVNILTLLGLVLAIGIVVDDSIVVLENIYHHVEQGLSPMAAALKGMQEITFAVIATTIALLAVFLPLTFQSTVTGRLFIEFAIALSGAVIISSFVALTLTPTVCARVLKLSNDEPNKILRFFEDILTNVTKRYERTLEWALVSRKVIVCIAGAAFALTYFFYTQLESEFIPLEDKGRLFSPLIGPEGATSEYTNTMLEKMEAIMASVPEVAGYFSAVALPINGPGKGNEGLIFTRFSEDRSRRLQDIVAGPQGLGARFFTEIEGAFAIPIMPRSIGGGFSQPFQLVIKHPEIDKLNEIGQMIAGELRQIPTLTNVRPNFQINKPELQIQIARDRAASLGVSIETLSRTLQTLFGGLDLSNVKIDGKEYEVIVQLSRESRLTPSDIDTIYIRNDSGDLIHLPSIVDYTVQAGPNAIHRYNRSRSVTIEATPVGAPLGTIVEQVENLLDEKLSNEYQYEWTGEAQDLKEAGSDSFLVATLAILIIYMVLAAQFESLLHPLTVMLAIPLGAFGAVCGVWLMSMIDFVGNMMYGWANYAPDPPWIASLLSAIIPRIPSMTINLYSQIGVLLLFGLVTKNSILLVDFANQAKERGLSALEAMREAGKRRLRPILMTAFGTILGILPIAIGLGAGAESRRGMGVAIVSGMIISTFLTLYVVPVVYILFDDLRSRVFVPKKSVVALVLLSFVFLPLPLIAEEEAAYEADLLKAEEEAVKSSDEGKSKDDHLTLDQCVDLALKQNFRITDAQAEIQKQSGVELQAKSISRPKVRATSEYRKIDEDRISSFDNGMNFGSDETWNGDVRVEQPLILGGEGIAAKRAARYRAEAAEHALQKVINETVFEVHTRFYDVLLSDARIDVRKEAVELLEEELRTEKNRLEAGIVSQFNVLRAEVELANTKTPLIQARNDFRISLEELSRVLAAPHRDASLITPSISVTGELTFEEPELDLPKALQKARENRPEIEQLQLIIKAEEEGVKLARSSYFPDFFAFAGYGGESSRFDESLSNIDHGWELGIRLQWDIFNGGNTIGEVREAHATKQQAYIALKEQILNVDIEVRRAMSRLAEARELVYASRKVVEQAEESLRLARSRFSAGSGRQLDVLDTRVSLTEAQTNKIESLHTFNVALAELKRATGAYSFSPQNLQ